MARLLKALFFALFLLSGTTGTGLADVVDEMAGPGPAPVTDRAMSQGHGINLDRVQKTFDNSNEKANTIHYNFDPDSAYKIRLREFMVTTIVLPKNEIVDGFAVGDPNVFIIKALAEIYPDMGNVLHVKPKYAGADTNLVVYGESGYLYTFYLRSDTVKSTFNPNLTIFVDDPNNLVQVRVEPLDGLEMPSQVQAEENGDCVECARRVMPDMQDEPLSGEYLDSLPFVDPSSLNFNYALGAGDLDLAPQLIFDDGFFTYFRFGEDLRKIKHLPVVWEVVNGVDEPVNTRIEGGTLIAETVSKKGKWTLRNGDSFLCVRPAHE